MEVEAVKKKSRFWQVPAREVWEWAFMRLGFALVVWWSLPSIEAMSVLQEQPYPTGLANLIDLTFFADHQVYRFCYYMFCGALLVYVSGFLLPVALPVVASMHIGMITLYNSQGATHHAYQLVSLILLAQWLVCWTPYVWRILGKPAIVLPAGLKWRDYMVWYSLQVIAAAYVIAGVIKLMRSKGLWIIQSPNLAVQLMKTNAQNYHDKLRVDVEFEQRAVVAQFMIDNPNVTRLFLGGGLLIELLAFLLLVNRVWALVVGFFILALHWGIDMTMGLNFKYQMTVVAIFLVNVPFWAGWLGKKLVSGKDDALLK